MYTDMIRSLGPLKTLGIAFTAGAAFVSVSVALPLYLELRQERSDHRETRTELRDVRAERDAEVKARLGVADRLVEEQQRSARLSAERDEANRRASENRERIVTRTVEIIRESEPEWSNDDLPERARLERLRSWCERRPEGTYHDLCRDQATDDG